MNVAVWRWAALILAVWTIVGLFLTTQTWMAFAYGGRGIAWSQAFRLAMTDAYLWAALTPLILWLAGRLRFERRRWMYAAPVHLLASVVCAIVQMRLYVVIAAPLGSLPERTFTSNNLAMAVGSYKPHLNVLTYWIIVGAAHTVRYYRESRARQLKASQLETRLAEARLEALKSQLHPHFLFNTLHSISTLMHRDVEAADRMIAQLSDLLRLAMDDQGLQEAPLKRELEFLDRYLAIEKVRFPDRLRVSTTVEPGVLDARVPSLLLQPLVENAVRYAVAPRASGGEIRIRAGSHDDSLRIEIEDDGPGLARDWKEGLGLANTRARLAQLYGSDHAFTVGGGELGGTLVRVEIPFRS